MPAATPPEGLKSLEENSEWFAQQNAAQFVGHWVAVLDKTVVAHGPDLAEVTSQVRAVSAGRTPFIVSIPKGDVTV